MSKPRKPKSKKTLSYLERYTVLDKETVTPLTSPALVLTLTKDRALNSAVCMAVAAFARRLGELGQVKLATQVLDYMELDKASKHG